MAASDARRHDRQHAAFEIGAYVRRIDSPDVTGVVTAAQRNPQTGVWMYTVRFGTSRRGVPEDALELVPETVSPWDDLSQSQFASAESFRRRMTYERLQRPPSRIAGSFGSAKAAFYPFQFKPLLKFLENPRQRILIADDVGLGKTIEAGYILRELRAREPLQRVLVVVPARLRQKWKMELQRRFDEQFETVAAGDLRRYLLQLERGIEPGPMQWIISIEAIRSREVIELLDRHPVAIDLVIVDECHRMRNPPTLQHRVGTALALCADALVMLSATPVQTSRDDLFHLLRILDSDMFPDREVFLSQLEAQRPILRALRAIRRSTPDVPQALRELEEVGRSEAMRAIAESDLFESIVERARECSGMSRAERVELQRDLSETCLTSAVISRTRKADVLQDRPRRSARALEVRFTAQEQSFYDSVEELCAAINPGAEGWGQAMSLLMAHRYTASCIPAAVDYLRERMAGAGVTAADLELETEDAAGWMTSLEGAPHERDSESALGSLMKGGDRAIGLIAVDSKLEALLGGLRHVWGDDEQQGRPPRKVVLFSFFKRTLRYLEKMLRGRGIECRRMDGDLSVPDREAIIEEFANDPRIHLLLSSEVGSEGLDLQVASVVVNYDLPWNPMVLEQRIGRLDRIGQQDERIVIINMAVHGTVEERILLRLYQRIGIFEDTLGEIDPILGQRIEQLTLDALAGRLSPEEELRRTDETADAVVRSLREAHQLGDDADALIAADQAFLDEVGALIGERRIPDGRELFEFLRGFLSSRYPGCRLPRAAIEGIAEAHFSGSLGAEILSSLGQSPANMRVVGMIQRGPFPITFNPQALLANARAELVHQRHPLIRVVRGHYRNASAQEPRSFAVALGGEEEGSKNLLLFSVWMYDVRGLRARTELVPFIFSPAEMQLLPDERARALFRRMIDDGEEVDPPPEVDPGTAEHARGTVEEAGESARTRLEQRETTLNAARHARRRATLENTIRARRDAAQRRLEALHRSDAPAFPIRMAEHLVAREQRRLDEFLAEGDEAASLHVESEEIAVGVLVTGAPA